MVARRRPKPGATIPSCPAARRSGGHHRCVTSLPQGPAQWRRRGRDRSRAWRGPGERGSFEIGPDGRAFSEGKEQLPGKSGRDSCNACTALEQEMKKFCC